MKHKFINPSLGLLLLLNLQSLSAQDNDLLYPKEKHFKNIKQLTFSGENAEAYWSFDDSKLIFQATNEKWGEDCDQIYIIDNFFIILINIPDPCIKFFLNIIFYIFGNFVKTLMSQ